MTRYLSALVALVCLLAICRGCAAVDAIPSVPADPSAMSSINIIIVTDQDKRGVVDFIKDLVLKGSSPQDDDTLTTQIITLLSPRNATTDLAAKMMPNIKSALHSRGKPAQLRQIIVKLTEMSPKFGANDPDKDSE
ncbi:hypothetical protein PF001_g14647 [Phytophthora fragariae]|uniref:RxLR effector protein n=1 Tax=Phytophthora fragariae TaxID=53985 RepID=A0A6A4DBK9_9STRA|nr:hypothetical protein PF003_g34661 [Phytophthora fragariae]KAE9301033.1 hypothetical protein PF001_g14647 [Phytophthora fragariae]